MGNEGRPRIAGAERAGDLDAIGGFADFVKEGGYSADQVREAYYRLCGVSEEEQDTPEVTAIVETMQKLTDEGVPLNWFASFIGVKQDVEDAVPNFHGYVDTLHISDKEKGVLKSIVDKGRSGEVTCFVDGKPFSELTIENKDGATGAAAAALMEAFESLVRRIPEGKKYEFTFSES